MTPKDLRIPKSMVILFVSDLLLLVLIPVVSIYLHVRFRYGALGSPFYSEMNYSFVLLSIAVFVVTLMLFDQYDVRQDFRKSKALLRMLIAVGVGTVFLSILLYAFQIAPPGPKVILPYVVLVSLGIVSVRIVYSAVNSVGVWGRRTMIVGCGESGRRILESIHKNSAFGIKVIGFLEKKQEKSGSTVQGVPVYWQKGTLREEVMRHQPKLLIVAMRRHRFYDLIEDLTWCAQQGIEIWDTPTTYEYLEKRIPLRYVDDLWLYHAALNWPKLHVKLIKRIMDIVVATFGLIISLPLLVVTFLAVWLETGFPVLLRQKRVGKNGRLFSIYKVRSMYQTEPKPGEKGCCENDKRVTKVGRVIRKLHIDEIPQLINVLKGDLSMVGPRSELYDFIREFMEKGAERTRHWYPERLDLSCEIAREESEKEKETSQVFLPYIEQRFTVDQGITGWAQVMQPIVTSTYDDLRIKLEYDLYYIKNISMFLDILIMLKTVKVVLLGKGK